MQQLPVACYNTELQCNDGGCQPQQFAYVRLTRQERREVRAMAREMLSADELVPDGCHEEFWQLWCAARPAQRRSVGRCQ